MVCFIARIRRIIVAGVLILVSVCALAAAIRAAPAQPAAPALTEAQLDRLVAPIALYPDPLVAQILMAATYPLEVVEADRWLQIPSNSALKADSLTAALQRQPWDPSIKSLVSFPRVLKMMDTNLDWTEQLGDAFLAQQGDVMDAIQRLRRRAEKAGSLTSTPQQVVSSQEQEILIEPANPDLVYVPDYNPWCVFGAWPYPGYPPFYFEPWAGYCVPTNDLIVFGTGVYPFGYWAWGDFEWRHHLIRIDSARFRHFRDPHESPGGIWQHDPTHRHGVPYRDPATAARFLGTVGAARGYRGFPPASEATPLARPVAPSGRHIAPPGSRAVPRVTFPQQPMPPAFQSFGPGARVREESQRGSSSRMSPPAAIAPSFQPRSMPSLRAAPMPGIGAPAPGFHGGGGARGGGRR